MHGLRQAFNLAVVVLVAVLQVGSARAQDQGAAVVTSPLEGTTISGVVPVMGSATHPQFARYELAFAYSPNPTDTWFSIPVATNAPVVNELLGRWDTSGVSDGIYVLRLRVYAADGTFLETLVHNVAVQNATPPPPPTLTPDLPTVEAVTPTPPPVETEPAIALPPTSTPRPTRVPAQPADDNQPPDSGAANDFGLDFLGTAFLAGVRVTLISFLLLGAYISLRAALRTRPKE